MDRKQILSELQMIVKLKERVLSALQKAPEGTLWCQMNQHRYPQYYLVSKEDRSERNAKREYLPKKNQTLIRSLVQKEYNQVVLKKLLAQEEVLRSFLHNYEENILGAAYEQMPPAKRRMVKPYRLSDDDYREQWLKQHTLPPNSYPKDTQYRTEQGEYVRSKSEKIFLDKLWYLHIPYVYECPLTLSDGHVIYPDVTALNQRTRKTKYIELFGMMDDPDYCNRALEKIKLYNDNHLYSGDSFLFLMESKDCVLDVDQMTHLIQAYLI